MISKKQMIGRWKRKDNIIKFKRKRSINYIKIVIIMSAIVFWFVGFYLIVQII